MHVSTLLVIEVTEKNLCQWTQIVVTCMHVYFMFCCCLQAFTVVAQSIYSILSITVQVTFKHTYMLMLMCTHTHTQTGSHSNALFTRSHINSLVRTVWLTYKMYKEQVFTLCCTHTQNIHSLQLSETKFSTLNLQFQDLSCFLFICSGKDGSLAVLMQDYVTLVAGAVISWENTPRFTTIRHLST